MKRKNNQKLKKALEGLSKATSSLNTQLKQRTGKVIRDELLKQDKGIHREEMMKMGLYNIHKHKIFKSKKSTVIKPRGS